MDTTFTADALIARATAETGLANFGGDDYRPGLKQFIASCRDEGFVPAGGLSAIGDTIVRILGNRLRFEAILERHPEILDETIVMPLFIVGAGRVGSTKLHRLLANAVEVQSLPLWQVMHPVPLDQAQRGTADPRIALTKAFCDQVKTAQPQLYAAIETITEEPDEDTYMLDLTFMQLMFNAHANVPGYIDWLSRQDWRRPMAYYKKLLQFLQWQNGTAGTPMLLKGPVHTSHMDVLLELFPDAKFVQIHRHPLTCIASMTKVVWMLHQLQPVAHLDTIKDAADTMLLVMKTFIVDSLNIRDANPALPIADFTYEDVRDDATGLARKIFAFWGQPLSDESIARMGAWETANGQHKLGRFEYTIEEAQIDMTAYQRIFAPYLDRFYPAAGHSPSVAALLAS